MTQPSDARVKALRRFAIAITIVNLAGHFLLGFEQAWAHPLVGLAVAYSLELGLEAVRARAARERPAFLQHGLRGFVDFLLPAHISGLACAMLLYPGARFAPIAFAAAVAIGSKALFRAPTASGGSRHFLNPSNFGIAATLVLFPWVGSLTYHFTENATGWVDGVLPMIVVSTGSALNALLTKRIPLIFAWLTGFALQAAIRSVAFDVPFWPAIVPMSGVPFVLFTFYMISDPGTTPQRPRNQMAFGFAVAAVYGVLTSLHIVFAIFFALVIVCVTRGLYLHAIAWAPRRASHRANVEALAPIAGGTGR